MERTDHTHLGQLITYASGLKAVNIVWVTNSFTEEHRSALDWLNEVADSEINFFGLEIELWKIGESDVAPKFNVISKPNDWNKTVTKNTSAVEKELTENRKNQVSFWEGFYTFCKANSKFIRPTKPHPQNWMNISVGRAGFKLCAVASFYSSEHESYEFHEIRSELVIDGEDAKNYFDKLFVQKEAIESEMGEPLFWYKADNVRMCKMYLKKTANIVEVSNRIANFKWLLDKLEKMNQIFSKRIRTLD